MVPEMKDYEQLVTPWAGTSPGYITGEPAEPLPGWPASHVVAGLTPPGVHECVFVEVQGVRHLLHSSTAVELFVALGGALGAWGERQIPVLAQVKQEMLVGTEVYETVEESREAGRLVLSMERFARQEEQCDE